MIAKARTDYRVLFLLLLMNWFFGTIVLKDWGGRLQYLWIAMLLWFMFAYRKVRSCYTTPLILYGIFVFLSCVYSTLYNGQSFIRCARATYPAWGLLSFFTFFLFKMNAAKTFKVLRIFSVLFCFAYLIQWAVYPAVIFGAGDTNLVSLDTYRARMPSSICSYLLFFYGIKNFLSERKPIYIVYLVLGFTCMIIMGFRSLMAISVFMAIIMILTIYRHSIQKTLVVIAIAGAMVWAALQVPLVQDKIDEMMERQESEQTFQNSDYIRYTAFYFFQNEVFVKPGEKIFGGGYPDGKSSYSRYLVRNQMFSGLYWVDLGIIGLSWIIGIPAVALLVYLVVRCSWRCKDQELMFIRYALLAVLGGSIGTSMEIFRECNMYVIGLLFYLEYVYHKENGYRKGIF